MAATGKAATRSNKSSNCSLFYLTSALLSSAEELVGENSIGARRTGDFITVHGSDLTPSMRHSR